MLELEYKIIRLNLRYKVIRFRWEIMKFLLHMRLKIRLTDIRSNEVQSWSIKQMFWKRKKVFSPLNRLNWLGWSIFLGSSFDSTYSSFDSTDYSSDSSSESTSFSSDSTDSSSDSTGSLSNSTNWIVFYSITIFFNLKDFK